MAPRLDPVGALALMMGAVLLCGAGAAADRPPTSGVVELVPAGPMPPLPRLPGSAPDPAATPLPDEELGIAAGPPPAVAAAPLEEPWPPLPGGPPPAAVDGASGLTVAAPAPEPPLPGRLTPSQKQTLAFQLRSYLRQVHERIGEAWTAPVAPPPGQRRVALVTVVIARSGAVVDARIDRPSRDEGFDLSALRAVRRPYLFPPLPAFYPKPALEVGLRFADPGRPARR